MKMKRLVWAIIIVCCLLIIGATSLGYYIFWKPNVKKEQVVLFIPHIMNKTEALSSIISNDFLRNEWSFRIAYQYLMTQKLRPGKYIFSLQSNNLSMIRILRRGQHFPVHFTFTAVRTKEQLLHKLSKYDFLFSWEELNNLLNDDNFLSTYHLNSQTALAVFIPNTYEFYYDISAQEFFEKMYGYYQRYWTDERKQLAQHIGLSPIEVITLASIVEEENYKESEKAIIAGLYMNRLHKNMPLQADPTVRFALNDFTITRVLQQHLQTPSAYNTYLNTGLPPGPIRTPLPSTVDSVLHYTHHHYLYMCAKEDFSGYHNFTHSYEVHLQNAKRYQRALSTLNNK